MQNIEENDEIIEHININVINNSTFDTLRKFIEYNDNIYSQDLIVIIDDIDNINGIRINEIGLTASCQNNIMSIIVNINPYDESYIPKHCTYHEIKICDCNINDDVSDNINKIIYTVNRLTTDNIRRTFKIIQ